MLNHLLYPVSSVFRPNINADFSFKNVHEYNNLWDFGSEATTDIVVAPRDAVDDSEGLTN